MQFPPLFFIKKIIQPQIIIPLPYGDYFGHWINMKEGNFNNKYYPLVFQAQFKFKWPSCIIQPMSNYYPLFVTARLKQYLSLEGQYV